MYRQLTQEKRYTLYALRQEGYSLRKIPISHPAGKVPGANIVKEWLKELS